MCFLIINFVTFMSIKPRYYKHLDTINDPLNELGNELGNEPKAFSINSDTCLYESVYVSVVCRVLF